MFKFFKFLLEFDINRRSFVKFFAIINQFFVTLSGFLGAVTVTSLRETLCGRTGRYLP